MESHPAGVVVEANLKFVEYATASEKIESDSKSLRKSDGSSSLKTPNFNCELVNKNWNIAAVPNNDHLASAALPIDSGTIRFVHAQQAKGRPRINKNPELMGV